MMTYNNPTVAQNSPHLLTNPVFHSKKAGTDDLFYSKEVILDHAVDIHEKTQVWNKTKLFGRLNAALYRSLKGFFDVGYK
ncbi:MAG: hypothetical protein IH995_02995 [Proteobacteria bacterium]|nr:hypothetical protein [Pseudomonadota bacterium]